MQNKPLIDYSKPRQHVKRDWLGIALAWFFGSFLIYVVVALVNGLNFRGVW